MTSIKEAFEIVQCMIRGDQIEAAIVDTDTMASLGDVVRAALAQLDSADAVAWQYRDDRWDDDRWHVCAERPRDTKGRRIRALYTGPLPNASPDNGAEKALEKIMDRSSDFGSEPRKLSVVDLTNKISELHDIAVAALHSTSAAGETTSSDWGALSSLPSGENEPVVTQAYPSSEAADVLAMKEAWRKFSMLMIVDGDPPSIVYPTDIDANAWASAYDDLRAAIDKLSPEVKEHNQ